MKRSLRKALQIKKRYERDAEAIDVHQAKSSQATKKKKWKKGSKKNCFFLSCFVTLRDHKNVNSHLGRRFKRPQSLKHPSSTSPCRSNPSNPSTPPNPLITIMYYRSITLTFLVPTTYTPSLL